MSDGSASGTGPRSTAPDRHQIERLNSLWSIIDQPVSGGGWRARLSAGARRLLGRVLSRQQEFNASVVDHINRNMVVLDGLYRELRLTSDRLDDMDDGMARYREALLARERRKDAALAAIEGLAAQQQELRTAVGLLQQAGQQMKREVARLAASGHSGSAGASVTSATPTQALPPTDTTARTRQPASQFDERDSHKYVGFEDRFRGSAGQIRERLGSYLPIFAGSSDVLDIGCGRGEFLALLREHGVRARGIDLNPAMVEVCQAQQLDATAVDAVTYLRAQQPGSLGGIFAAQVVEHLEPRDLGQLLDAAFDALRPGAPLVLETINPACWYAFFESYLRDITHVRPLHPETLQYLMVASGFQQVEIRFSAPYPQAGRLQPVAAAPDAVGTTLSDWSETLNANVDKLNRLLFTWLDYAAVGRRP